MLEQHSVQVVSRTNVEFLKKWFEEVWNKQNEAYIDEAMSPDTIAHGLTGTVHGAEAFKQFHRQLNAVFSNIRTEVEAAIESGDFVSHHTKVNLVHKLTGRQCEIHGSSLARIKDGKLVESWDSWDFLGLIIQMGALPEDAFARATQGHKFV